jgi:hypothetical protein
MIATLSVVCQFIYLGALNWQFFLVVGFFNCISAFAGVTCAGRIVKITGRQSTLIFILTGAILFAAVMLPLKYLF